MHVLGMPPAFVLSQDQTLKFIPGRLPSTPSKGLHNARINAQAMTAQRRRPRIPSTFSTLSISNPQDTQASRGRAYKPSSQLPSIKIRFAFASARLSHIGTIIQDYCVLCFGEKEPALGDKAERRTCDAEPSHDPAGHSPE